MHLPQAATARWFGARGSVVRTVDERGFFADLSSFAHLDAPLTQSYVAKAVKSPTSMLICGSAGAGKLTILKAMGMALQTQKKQQVAFTSFDPRRAHRLGGIVVHNLLGLRVNSDELPIQEQMEGTFERHVRLVDSTYENALCSVTTCDVLVVDALHLCPPVILKSLDAVCRRVRHKPNDSFGGLRILAAADFWAMPVHPGSDTGGYSFQLPQWNDMFPQQYYLDKVHGQDPELGRLADAALMGTLSSADVSLLETKCVSKAAAAKRNFVQMTDTSKALFEFRPRFPKQPFILHNPPKAVQIKRTEVGNFLINLLYQSAFAERFGLVGKLSLEVGSPAHLIYPLLKKTSQHGKRSSTVAQLEVDIPAGVPGEVVHIHEHRVTMSFPTLHRTVDIPRMRVSLHHSEYPELTYATEQFPLFPRKVIAPKLLVEQGGIYNVAVDGRKMADTNDLGNILARMRTWDDFRIFHVKDFMRLEGMVHEPTRIYYSKLRKLPPARTPEMWCRNCKGHVATSSFFEHWDKCLSSVRWCSECDATVPLSKLEAHREKHEVVLCIDCGQAIEWRYWETHRLSCAPMMRELSVENEFLPEVTRKIAVELGLDKRDLHTVKLLSRSILPKSKKDVYNRQTS